MRKILIVLFVILYGYYHCQSQNPLIRVNLSIEWLKDFETLPQVFGTPIDSLPFLRIDYNNLSDKDLYFASLHHSDYDVPYFPHQLICWEAPPYSLSEAVESAKREAKMRRSRFILHNRLSGVDSIDSLGEREYYNSLNQLYNLLYGNENRLESNLGGFIFWKKSLRREVRKNKFQRVVFLKAGETFSQYLNLYGMFLAEIEGEFVVENQVLPDVAYMSLFPESKSRKLPKIISGYKLYSGIMAGDSLSFDFKNATTLSNKDH